MKSIYDNITGKTKNGKKMFAWLVDPDKYTINSLSERLEIARQNPVDFIFVGGSLSMSNNTSEIIKLIKSRLDTPVILFPGNTMQIDENADGILFLTLISGRNPDYLIGRHVETAMILRQSNIEIIPTGYIIVDTGITTSVSYMSNTTPVPYNKAEIAVNTAIAGELLGLKMIFLEGGSGAKMPVDVQMIKAVRENITVPLIVGGGIVNITQAGEILNSGADIIVAGNSIEKNPGLIKSFSGLIADYS